MDSIELKTLNIVQGFMWMGFDKSLVYYKHTYI